MKNFAAQLAEAEATQVGIDPLTVVDPEITVDEAYYIQLENIKKKLSEGQKIVGKENWLNFCSSTKNVRCG